MSSGNSNRWASPGCAKVAQRIMGSACFVQIVQPTLKQHWFRVRKKIWVDSWSWWFSHRSATSNNLMIYILLDFWWQELIPQAASWSAALQPWARKALQVPCVPESARPRLVEFSALCKALASTRYFSNDRETTEELPSFANSCKRCLGPLASIAEPMEVAQAPPPSHSWSNTKLRGQLDAWAAAMAASLHETSVAICWRWSWTMKNSDHCHARTFWQAVMAALKPMLPGRPSRCRIPWMTDRAPCQLQAFSQELAAELQQMSEVLALELCVRVRKCKECCHLATCSKLLTAVPQLTSSGTRALSAMVWTNFRTVAHAFPSPQAASAALVGTQPKWWQSLVWIQSKDSGKDQRLAFNTACMLATKALQSKVSSAWSLLICCKEEAHWLHMPHAPTMEWPRTAFILNDPLLTTCIRFVAICHFEAQTFTAAPPLVSFICRPFLLISSNSSRPLAQAIWPNALLVELKVITSDRTDRTCRILSNATLWSHMPLANELDAEL